MSNTTEDLTRPARQRGWRVVDIIVAAVLGVAIGLVFWGWDAATGPIWDSFDAVAAGFSGLLTGVWLLGGTVGGLVIRKPGAALLVEVVAAAVEAELGNKWGITNIYSGLAQGAGAELVFLVLFYKRWNLPVAMLAGAAAAAGEWIYEFIHSNSHMGTAYNLTYLACMLVSGVLIAGLLSWLLTRALASTGALDRFAAGREARSAR